MIDPKPALPTDLDPKAVEILFRKHWSKTGWTKGVITPAEFDYAKQAGMMFDPMPLAHESVIARAINIRQKIRPQTVGNAFLASLSTRRMDWRSALGSLASILNLPNHSQRNFGTSPVCAICDGYAFEKGEDINTLSFERLKWGGVRHVQPYYATLDLEWFSMLPPLKPTQKDLEIFTSIIKRISLLPESSKPGDIDKSLHGLVPSNSPERRKIIDILGLAGVLIPKNLPTFWCEYPYFSDRKQPNNKNDWAYPVMWWTGFDGINHEAVKFWFGDII